MSTWPGSRSTFVYEGVAKSKPPLHPKLSETCAFAQKILDSRDVASPAGLSVA
jgi:hypothetical protein